MPSLHSSFQTLSRPDFSQIQTLVLAGGGNRCWWQAGVLEHLLAQRWTLPPQVIGTSAGAAIATAALLGRLREALTGCQTLYASTSALWEGWRAGRPWFAHEHVYPDWVASFVSSNALERLRENASRLQVVVARPAPWLGTRLSLSLGTVAYMIDKWGMPRLHPRLPHWLGLRQEFLPLEQSSSVKELMQCLVASASAVPFLAARPLQGRMAFDGGYVDNVPIPPGQTLEQRCATLVLLTRHQANWPEVFRWKDRTYWQPSARIDVSTWDCRAKTLVDNAFVQGQRDAQKMTFEDRS